VSSAPNEPPDSFVEKLELGDLEKSFLRSRWLEQLAWLEQRAGKNQARYYALRTVAIGSGVIVPALVSLDIKASSSGSGVAWLTFALSLVVALSAALDGFYRFGDRWRNYRRTAEALKSRGWLFLQLAGPYAEFGSHEEAYTTFAADVEAVLQEDVQNYVTRVAAERRPSED
jgi:hypothetical protein